jgi:bisphosphoglycerate-independent phosphoglycerate mutase (AlkP superfamily)
VDAGLAQIYQALKPRGGVWIITADHGNAETMIDPITGGPHTMGARVNSLKRRAFLSTKSRQSRTPNLAVAIL